MNDGKKGVEGEEKQYMKDPTCPFLSHKLPSDLNEVAYVIAKIHKYGNIDDYAEKLIREDIEKMRKSSECCCSWTFVGKLVYNWSNLCSRSYFCCCC